MAAELSDRQREIVAAARGQLARDGVEALSLGAVAKALGIKTPSLYKHFASRAELEAAAFAHGMVALEIAQRFPLWSKLEKSWAPALDAFVAARPPQ